MIYYVAHKYQGSQRTYGLVRQIVHDMQVKDLQNTYICPLMTLSHLKYGEIGFDEEMELCIDILSVCDVLLVVGEITKGVQREIDFAELVGMEVRYLEDPE